MSMTKAQTDALATLLLGQSGSMTAIAVILDCLTDKLDDRMRPAAAEIARMMMDWGGEARGAVAALIEEDDLREVQLRIDEDQNDLWRRSWEYEHDPDAGIDVAEDLYEAEADLALRQIDLSDRVISLAKKHEAL